MVTVSSKLTVGAMADLADLQLEGLITFPDRGGGEEKSRRRDFRHLLKLSPLSPKTRSMADGLIAGRGARLGQGVGSR